MKTTSKHLTLILYSILFTSFCFAKSPDTTSCLQLSGKILKIKTTTSNEYTVSLISGNTVIETKTIKGNNSFKFNLKKNGWYTVRISKEGYVSRTVSIDTKLSEGHDGFYKFQFETELIDEQEALTLNKDALNMPIAYISYDPKKHWFTHNATYTNMVKKNIYTRHVQLNK